MPIRFECGQCGQRLSIARRKAGAEIDCPTCGVRQQVPGDPAVEESADELDSSEVVEAPAESAGNDIEDLALSDITQPDPDPPPLPDDVDLTETIDLECPPISSSSFAIPPLPPPKQAPEPVEPAVVRLPFPWAIYAQALLLLTVAIGAFVAGYYLGRQDGAPARNVASEQEFAVAPLHDDGFSEERVLLETRLFWTPTLGRIEGDEGALFLALPQDRIPARALPIAGLLPGSENQAEAEASAAAIRSTGGVFERAGSDGTVAAVLPREGRYYLLMISRNALRPAGEPINARVLAKMKQYFASPEELVGNRKYAWERLEIHVGAAPVEHDFGLDGL